MRGWAAHGFTVAGRIAALMAAAAYIGLYLFVANGRLSYPYELEWIEGASVDHVARILSGGALYVEPSLAFVPFIYTPLYFYVSAVFAALLGIGFFPLRLVSFLSSIGCLLVASELVRRRSGSAASGFVAAGLFAATFRIGGAWLDLARVDSLFLLLVISGVLCLSSSRWSPSVAIAGLVIGLAFLTKQTALIVAVPLVAYTAIRERGWRRLAFAGTLLAFVAGSSLAADAATGGWFRYYVFELPRQHRLVTENLSAFWTDDVGRLTLPLFALCLWGLASLYRAGRRDDLTLAASVLVGMLGASWLSRMHSGGYANVLLPGYLAMAVCCGISLPVIAPRLFPPQGAPGGRSGPVRGAARDLTAASLLIAQLALLAYSPMAQIPKSGDERAGDELMELLESVDGDVLIPFHGHLARLAGKRPHAHLMPIADVLRGRDGDVRSRLLRDIRTELDERRFAAIVLDRPWMVADLSRRYELTRGVFRDERVFWPVTGLRTRPEVIYLPRADGAPRLVDTW